MIVIMMGGVIVVLTCVKEDSCYHTNLNGRHTMSGLPGVWGIRQLLSLYNDDQGFRVYTNSVMMIRSKTCGLG